MFLTPQLIFICERFVYYNVVFRTKVKFRKEIYHTFSIYKIKYFSVHDTVHAYEAGRRLVSAWHKSSAIGIPYIVYFVKIVVSPELIKVYVLFSTRSGKFHTRILMLGPGYLAMDLMAPVYILLSNAAQFQPKTPYNWAWWITPNISNISIVFQREMFNP